MYFAQDILFSRLKYIHRLVHKIHERIIQAFVTENARFKKLHVVILCVLLSFVNRDTVIDTRQQARALLFSLLDEIILVCYEQFHGILGTIVGHLLQPMVKICEGGLFSGVICDEHTMRIPKVLLCQISVLVQASCVPNLQPYTLAIHVHYPVLVVEAYFNINVND